MSISSLPLTSRLSHHLYMPRESSPLIPRSTMQLRTKSVDKSPSGSPKSDSSTLIIDNVSHNATIHQRCLIIRGRSRHFAQYGDHLKVTVNDAMGEEGPEQTWPMSMGHFKALVMLSPGTNKVHLQRYQGSQACGEARLTLEYVPLLQTPPLHLAIMIAKDSPLVTDCPSYKAGGISSAHSGLDAAVSKLRVAAYMWQALTAEDMWVKGLGRRSFRLEEEWAQDTTSRTRINRHLNHGRGMASVAKVHLIRTDKTVAELQDKEVAQQNKNATRANDLHKYFEDALKAHGGVFDSSNKPVVAGLILDSHYHMEDNILLGHAALGCHKADGLSLGIFGSHLTYSWPRFFEEIPSCLTDTTPPGDTLCNDNGECGTAWEACAIGQGAMLHEVGHAFGAPHTTGIMARGYAQHWPRSFIAETAYCSAKSTDGITVIPDETRNDACWDLKDALSFKFLPHFRLPGDPECVPGAHRAIPSIQPVFKEDMAHDDSSATISVTCKAGIKSVTIPGLKDPVLRHARAPTELLIDLTSLDRETAIPVTVLAGNGKEAIVKDAWKLFGKRDFIRIPTSDIVLQKRSVSVQNPGACVGGNMDTDNRFVDWAVLLRNKGTNGKLASANWIDFRVGAVLDGCVIKYDDGQTINCGVQYEGHSGRIFQMGGHQSESMSIPAGQDIAKVAISQDPGNWGFLGGIRMTLTNGRTGGALNAHDGYDENEDGDNNESADGVTVLEAGPGEKIVGFYGRSDKTWGGCCVEFGIICGPKEDDLPMKAYDMEELQNKTRA